MTSKVLLDTLYKKITTATERSKSISPEVSAYRWRGRVHAVEQYENQSEHLERLVEGFDQMYVLLVLQPRKPSGILYPHVQIIDDGLTKAFDHKVLLALNADGYKGV